jgi:UDP-N-acetylmuramyl pentapeptide phosphotransferase/UDP-N-acetylglucosamine-1-phosphate transferase
MTMQHIWALPLAFVVSILTLQFLLVSRYGKVALDQPNHRSLHKVAVPRTGGFGILIGIVAGFLWLGGPLSHLLAGMLLLAAISFVDDLLSLSASKRLLVQLLVCSVVLWFETPASGYVLLIFVILAITWMTNLYNFMDGADGLAGGMAVIGFSSYAVAAWLIGNPDILWISASIAAASAGFLFFNFSPARIFMGDVGSIPLGFAAGLIGYIGWQHGSWPIWFPVLVFFPFIVDASVTLIRRLLRGEKIWQAHRSHYYQRLVLIGWGHRKVALCEYVLMAGVSLSAISILNKPMWLVATVLATWVLLYAILMYAIDKRWSEMQHP